jgi:transposase InsO family protein
VRTRILQGIFTDDQGSNLQLLTELFRLLCIKPIRMMPYHPQTDGSVEQLNQMLKVMLHWAEWLMRRVRIGTH